MSAMRETKTWLLVAAVWRDQLFQRRTALPDGLECGCALRCCATGTASGAITAYPKRIGEQMKIEIVHCPT